jgi:peptidoglycan/LPS O-acetylase OafA/YrhL
MASMTRLARAGGLRRGFAAAVLAVGTALAMVILLGFAGSSAALSSQPPVGLGTAKSFGGHHGHQHRPFAHLRGLGGQPG